MPSSPQSLAHLIKRLQHRHHRALDRKLASLGISLVQWNALREIGRNPESSMHRLAELTFNSDQAFGTLATRLMRMGLIERRAGVGRANVHALTEKGETLFHQGNALFSVVVEQSFTTLAEDERTVLASLMTKLINADDLTRDQTLQIEPS